MPSKRRQRDDSVSFRDDDATLAAIFGSSARTESRGSRRGRAALALLVSLALLAAMGWGIVTAVRALRPERLLPETCVARADGRSVVLEHEQMHHAALITGVAIREGFGERGAAIALATALQESSLHNLDHGDRDSLGLFQQRPSQGWGTAEQVMDPFYATETFLEAMSQVDWRSGSINDVAQEVQHSGVPDGYAKREPDAEVLAAVFAGRAPDGVTCLDRHAYPGASGDFVAELNRTWGVQAVAQGATVTVTGADPAIANAWASFAAANMRQYGVVRVQRADRSWTPDAKSQGTWQTTTDAPLEERQVVVTFRA